MGGDILSGRVLALRHTSALILRARRPMKRCRACLLYTSGRMKEDYGKGEETSMGLVMDLEMLKTLLDQQAKLSGRKMCIRDRV